MSLPGKLLVSGGNTEFGIIKTATGKNQTKFR